MFKFVAPVVAVMLLAGCQSNGMTPQQQMGGLLGAAAGGVVGSQFGSGRGQLATTAAGAVLGGYLGTEVAAPGQPPQVVVREVPAPRYVESNHGYHGSHGHGRHVPAKSYRRGYREGYEAGRESRYW